MLYIDSGSRNPDHALGAWLEAELNGGLVGLRIQSGFFSENGIAPFVEILSRLAKMDAPVRIVLGSNDGGTLAPHLYRLVKCMGLPRAEGQLGVVYCAGGYFHSKTFHLHRTDGSQAAYVGSANMTLSGIAATHIEAGVLLDSRLGDDDGVLTEIAAATDAWFAEKRPGFELVKSEEDVARLQADGVLRLARPPTPPKPTGAGGAVPARPGLKPLRTYKGFGNVDGASEGGPTPGGAAQPPTPVPVEQVDGYPPYIVFAPGTTSPTTGANALSGVPLLHGEGLLFRVSSDTDRLWKDGKAGTANFTIPNLAAPTLRFGRANRPRAEFDIEVRYLAEKGSYVASPSPTNVSLYGYGPNPTGNKDRRLVIPKPPVNELLPILVAEGLPLPTKGDLAILEWPISSRPTFRMTFVEPGSVLAERLKGSWEKDRAQGHVSGISSTWLPIGMSPAW